MSITKCTGILLAAGRSRRMGKLKQLLPWPTDKGTTPLVAAAFDSIRAVCNPMLVVVGHESDKIIAALQHRDYHAVGADPDAPMYESIRSGLQRAEQLSPTQSVLVHPADHPEVSQQTLDTVVRHATTHPQLAVSPCYDDRGGHPVLLPPRFLSTLIDWRGMGGLRQFWLDNPELHVRIPVDDATVIRDLDTPEDYNARVNGTG